MSERFARTKIFLALLLSFAFYVFCFEPFGAAELGYIFIVPPYLIIRSGIKNKKFYYLCSLALSILSWVAIIAWLRHVYPPSGYVFWLGLSIAVGLVVWVWYFYLPRFIPQNCDSVFARFSKLILLSSIWIALEYLRSVLFTGFPWLLLGHSQWNRPVTIQLVEFAGTWIVSFTLIFFGMALSEYIYRQYLWHRSKFSGEERNVSRLVPEFYLAVMLIMSSVFYFNFQFPKLINAEKQFRVGMIQTDFAGLIKWDPKLGYQNLKVIEELSSGLKASRADLILWPESCTPPMWPVIGCDQMREWIEKLSHDLQTPILMGNNVYIETEKEPIIQGAAFFVSPENGLNKNYYAKEHLVPFGEYLPSWCFFIDKTVVPIGRMTPGNNQPPIDAKILEKDFKVGCLICYEDVFMPLGRRMAQNKADFFFVCTNDSWYGKEGGAWQHAVHSAFQAVASRRPVLRASNNGLSCVFDQYGRMLPTVTLKNKDGKTWDGTGEICVPIDLQTNDKETLNPYDFKKLRSCPMLDDNKSIYFRGAGYADLYTFKNFDGKITFYTRYGDWFAFGCIFIAIIGISRKIISRRVFLKKS